MEGVLKRNPGEPEFVQAVYEVASSIFPFIADKPIYHELQILERMAEPERVISFRIRGQMMQAACALIVGGAFSSILRSVPTRGGYDFTLASINPS